MSSAKGQRDRAHKSAPPAEGPTRLEAGARSGAAAWWALAVFTLCAVASYTDRHVLSMLVDPIRRELLISDTQMGLIQGLAFASAYAFAGLPLGRLADRGQRVLLMCFGAVLWSVATAACGLATGFSGLFTARLLVGVSEAALAPAAFSMIGDLFPVHRQGLALSVFVTGTTVGQGAALAVGGGLLHFASSGALTSLPALNGLAPWRVVLLCLAPPGILMALLLVLTVDEPVRRTRQSIAGHISQNRDVVRALLKAGTYVIPTWVGLALWTAGDASLFGWTPTFLSRAYHTTAAEAGSLLGSISIACAVIGTLLGGLAGDRLSRFGGSHMPLFACAAASVLGIAAIMIRIPANVPFVVVCFGLWVLLSNLTQMLAIIALQEALPAEIRGINIACVAFADQFFGASIGHGSTAMLTEYVLRDPQAVGTSIAIVIGTAALVATGLFWLAASALKSFDARIGSDNG
jgi:MFS family permease